MGVQTEVKTASLNNCKHEQIAGPALHHPTDSKGKGSTLTRCCAEAAVNLSLVITYTKFYLIASCLDRVCLEEKFGNSLTPKGRTAEQTRELSPSLSPTAEFWGCLGAKSLV